MYFRLNNGNNYSFSQKFVQTDDIHTNISQGENLDTANIGNGLLFIKFSWLVNYLNLIIHLYMLYQFLKQIVLKLYQMISLEIKLKSELNLTEQTKDTSDNYEQSKYVENHGESMTCK